MPLQIPTLDDRRYQDLLDEALARIPVHTPEWTNFNKSDPGVTLVELFAFMTENLLYRANFIPERNRLKFLSLLGIPLQPGSAARGLVQLNNERGPLRTVTLNNDLEVRAGQVPFRTEIGLDVLPIEAQVYYKYKLPAQPAQVQEYYRQLYTSYLGGQSLNTAEPSLYETRPFSPRGTQSIDLGTDTVDNSLWIALLLREGDKPYASRIQEAREAIAGRTISLGIVPQPADASRRLTPAEPAATDAYTLLKYQLPKIPVGGGLPADPGGRIPQYQSLAATPTTNVLLEPGIVQLTLLGKAELVLWDNLDPLEAGVGDFPPALEDTVLNERIITWLRISSTAAVKARLLWVGINTTPINQRAHIANELLPAGTGEPDQVMVLAKTPVIPGSVRLTVNGQTNQWQEIDDLLCAGPEVPVPDLRQPPGTLPVANLPVRVFTVDAESGEIRFGDGTRGGRLPFGATLRADYDYGLGAQGNVGTGSINTAPALPAGIKVTNPVPTWGGAEPESVQEGEKQITRTLQHHDRLVNMADFATITRRTPGVEIGRVDVLPAFNPELGSGQPGDAPGAVTLMLIPKYDLAWPNAPVPDRLFLDAICRYLDSRRLVTTELFLRGPNYKDIWVSVGMQVVPKASIAQVTEAVKQVLQQYLSPLPDPSTDLLDTFCLFATPQYPDSGQGWPLRKSVLRLELMAVANRVLGVLLVNDLFLVDAAGNELEEIGMSGLELPRVRGIAVVVGEPLTADQLPGRSPAIAPSTGQPTTPIFTPVPVVPENC